MKCILRTLFLLAAGLVFLIPSLSNVAGCSSGASSPPASIPAPVSSLITASPPDQTGLIVVAGQDGAVEPNATVLAANLTQGGTVFRWEDLLIRSAYAQVFQATANADANGAFTLEIDGASGDQIGLRQEVGGEQSNVTVVDVP